MIGQSTSFSIQNLIMDGGGGYGANNSQWQPGMSPRGPPPPRHNSPMQYYTSGSRHGGYGASPRFSSSTPRPNRYQNQGHYGSPSGAYPHSNQFNSPYAGGDRPLEYTPSPVRPRHNSSHHHQPNFGSPNTYGRGGGFSSFRGGRGGRVCIYSFY